MLRLHLHRACGVSVPELSRTQNVSCCCPWGSPARLSGTSCRICSLLTAHAERRYSNSSATTSAGPVPVTVPEVIAATPAQFNSDYALEIQRLEETFSKTSEDVTVHNVSILGPSWSFEAGNADKFEDYAKATKTVQDVQDTNRELSALLQELSGWEVGTTDFELSEPTASSSSRSSTTRSSRKPAASSHKARSSSGKSNNTPVITEPVPPPTDFPNPAEPAVPVRRKLVLPVEGNACSIASAVPAQTNNGVAPPAAKQRAKQRTNRYRRLSSVTPDVLASQHELTRAAYVPFAERQQASTKTSFYKGDDTLLSSEQEKALALKVKDFLRFEELEKQLLVTLGRPPEGEELSAAANLDYITFKMRWDAGKAAKKRMIEANLRLVISIAKKEAGARLTEIGVDNLVAEGMQGLLKGIEKFDHTKGFRFSTYAHWWIRQAVQRCLAQEAAIMRLPEYCAGDDTKVNKALYAYREQHNATPTAQELAKLTGVSLRRVQAVMEHKNHLNVASLEAGFDNENDERDDVMAAATDDPEEDADTQKLRADLEKLLVTLPHREAMVVKARYGLDQGGQPRTLEETGVLFNLTRERIRQIENQALRQLRAKHAQSGLAEHTLEDHKVTGRRAGGLRKQS